MSLTLATLEDVALVDAWVAAVLPGGDAAHVRVLVVVPPGGDAEATAAALGRASGLLRREVAQAIVRRRAPLLAFEVHLDGGLGDRDALDPEVEP